MREKGGRKYASRISWKDRTVPYRSEAWGIISSMSVRVDMVWFARDMGGKLPASFDSSAIYLYRDMLDLEPFYKEVG